MLVLSSGKDGPGKRFEFSFPVALSGVGGIGDDGENIVSSWPLLCSGGGREYDAEESCESSSGGREEENDASENNSLSSSSSPSLYWSCASFPPSVVVPSETGPGMVSNQPRNKCRM